MRSKLFQSSALHFFQEAIKEGGDLLLEGLWDAPKALITTLAKEASHKNILILTGANREERHLLSDFPFFSNAKVLDFPAWETLPSENIPPSPDIVGARYTVFHEIVTAKEPVIVLSGLQACLQRTLSADTFQILTQSLKVGDTLSLEKLKEQLVWMGFTKNSVAMEKGEFATRGGILDVFPVSTPDPYRIEFFGDVIDSIRTYDPVGQKSVASADHVVLFPALEMEFLKEETDLATLLDYMGKDTLVVFDDLLSLEDRWASLVSITETFSKTFCRFEELLQALKGHQKLFFSKEPIEQLTEIHDEGERSRSFYANANALHPLTFSMYGTNFHAKKWHPPILSCSDFLESDEVAEGLPNADALVLFLTSSELEKQVMENMFKEIAFKHPPLYETGYLSSGFALLDAHLLVIPYPEITKRYKIRRQKQRSTYHTPPSEFFDLNEGDTVVHLNNGIGHFLGIEKKSNIDGIETEFFAIEYAEKAKLYVPLNQANLITKYIGSGEERPKLHTLGALRWKRTREITEQAILGYANELLDLYAKRALHGGFRYEPDGADLISFEENFPFVETEDQLLAISAVKEDMCSEKALDRLICGDVGYGKTEVAMRAAFKAVVDGGKQVVVLTPTTVLALQHYENFQERMEAFPIRIGILSRFQSRKEIQKTLDDLATGKVDIVIGTHRLISKDVIFHNLGLVIIDEEQRFGVKAKEHLKKLKTGVDCLTLSATPIPRTLYMSMMGARDLSVISTPPQDRLPIKSIITEKNEHVVKNALLRELSRDGQAYFIHNRVETIFDIADWLKKLVPHARIVVGHGQMDGDELDQIFHLFKSGQADILVATTIVENGIDIPNANTILIDNAQMFGMADLYQLRGRVGRWNRKAYAYFIIPRLSSMPEIATKRLKALAETSGYGGGMKIAMRDLEIRGAGDILGTQQSGHVSAVGFYLYCKLLKRAINALQGKIPMALTDTRVEIPRIDARLPEQYIETPHLRMDIYQRLGESITVEEIEEIWKELKDRFGPPPPPVHWLYHLSRLRVFSSRSGITLIKQDKQTLIVELKRGSEVKRAQLVCPTFKTPSDLESLLIPLLKSALLLN